MATSEVRSAIARVARLYVGGAPSPEQEADARRALATAKIAEAIVRETAANPPLTTAQRARLVSLLGGAA